MDQRQSQYLVACANDDLGLRSARRTADRETYLACVDMPAGLALRGLTDAGRDLLSATAELPDTEQGLLHVLALYRYAVYAFVNVAAKLA